MTQKEWLEIGGKWKTTSGKVHVLFPALDSIMGNVKGKKILDIGCGDGAFIRKCKKKGAATVGVDISQKSINACKTKDPSGKYIVMDIKKKFLKQKFDYVLSLFVLLSFNKKREIINAIKNMRKSLNKEGRLIISVPHPAFEDRDKSEMKKTFNEDYIYSKKGLPMIYSSKKSDISFTDFHWMIEDYAEFIKKSGLAIEDIKEPIPLKKYKKENPKLYEKRVKYPSMIIFICRKV